MLSIILLSYYSSLRIVKAYEKLSLIMSENQIPFELIIIDDGSLDDSYEIALDLEKNKPNVRAYQLSRNYSSHYSVFAGLSICEGDCVMPIPDDEQQPYSSIVEMYRIWESGEKVVIPFRAKRNDGFLNNTFANLYYGIINKLSDITFPKGGADSFLIDKELVDIINERIHPVNTSIFAEILRLGYNPVFFPFERMKGINQRSRWTLRKKIRLFKDTFFSSSTWPVKIITRMGIFFSFIAFLIIVFYVYITIFGNTHFWGERLPGWTSTVVIISFFSGITLFSLGIIAEYIWRIYEEVKDRPGYIIKKKGNED
jgi:polyisoprenyl-phosphate glycosyltransferase